MKQALIDFLRNKRILIIGFGREGKSALEFIRTNLPEAEVAVANQAPLELNNLTVFSDEDYLDKIADYDIAIKSPGVPLKDIQPELRDKVTSMTDLFMRFCQNPVVGVTGTKGKSTTSSLIAHILNQSKRPAILAGNIGKPSFDIIDELTPETTVVLEISCHQLEIIHNSPHIAVITNLFEEHFDHYAQPEDYFTAKKNIYRFQGANDLLIYGNIFEHASTSEIEHLPMRKIDIRQANAIAPEHIKTSLIGEHFMLNIQTAAFACRELGLSDDQIIAAIETFRGLPCRLELVGTFNGITFYNDSIATAQEAAIASIQAVKNTDTIILGGMDRGLNYRPLVEFLRVSQVRNIILMPATSDSIQRIFNEAPFSQNIVHVPDLKEAVKVAYRVTAEDHACLLSPAAASYGFYKNFAERGEAFCQYVRELAK